MTCSDGDRPFKYLRSPEKAFLISRKAKTHGQPREQYPMGPSVGPLTSDPAVRILPFWETKALHARDGLATRALKPCPEIDPLEKSLSCRPLRVRYGSSESRV